MQLARSSQTQKQFDAGYADRVELTQARLEALAVERNALNARVDSQRALGRLEDALQRPLEGRPLPAYEPAPQPDSVAPMMPPRSTLIIAVMGAIIAALAWALVYFARDEFSRMSEAEDESIPTSSAVRQEHGFAVVSISPESQKASGVETALLQSAQSQAAVDDLRRGGGPPAADRAARAAAGVRGGSAKPRGWRPRQRGPTTSASSACTTTSATLPSVPCWRQRRSGNASRHA